MLIALISGLVGPLESPRLKSTLVFTVKLVGKSKNYQWKLLRDLIFPIGQLSVASEACLVFYG